MSQETKLSEVQSLQKSLDTENLYDLYEKNWSKEYRDKAREKYSVVGTLEEDFMVWPKDPAAVFTTEKRKYNAQIPCRLIESCPTYNRTSDISFDMCVSNLDYANNTFDLDGTEVITVFYDRKHNVFRTSRGNHRTLMKLLVDGPNATICSKIYPHDIDATDEEMLLKEASNFDRDNQFLGMTKTMKFKGALFNDLENPESEKDAWAKELYMFLDSCSPKIGISATNTESEIDLDAFGAIKKLMKDTEDKSNLTDPHHFMREILQSQAKYAGQTNGDKTYLSATLTKAMVNFRQQFSTEIDRVSKQNGDLNVWDTFLQYIFTGRNGLPMLKNLTQAELIKGNSMVRIIEYHVATLATLFNEFIAMKQLKCVKQGGTTSSDTTAITSTCKSWQNMLSKMNKPHFNAIVNSNLKSMYSVNV